MEQQQRERQQKIDELKVAKVELTRGDTSGRVYVRRSAGEAFMITPRGEALRGYEEEMQKLEKR